jgi:acetyltransferase-like isoleucine patch superfamily enzyme
MVDRAATDQADRDRVLQNDEGATMPISDWEDALKVQKSLPSREKFNHVDAHRLIQRLSHELRLVRPMSNDQYQFEIGDPSLKESVNKFYRDLPGEKLGDVSSHLIISDIIKKLIEIRAGDYIVDAEFRAKVTQHLNYHAPIIAECTPTPLPNFSSGIVLNPTRRDAGRQTERCVTELIEHLADALSGGEAAQPAPPVEYHMGKLEQDAVDTLASQGIILVTGNMLVGSVAAFQATCGIFNFINGFAGKFGAFSFTHSSLTGPLGSVGKYCSIAGDVTFGGAEHPLDRISTSPFTYDPGFIFGIHLEQTKTKFTSQLELKSEQRQERITIGNDVWIGEGVYIRGGVTIGNGAVVGAHSVVTRDVAPYEIVVGTPAKCLRRRFSDKIAERLLSLAWWDYAFSDFEGLPSTDPDVFIDGLQSRIEEGACKPYLPPIVYGSDIARLLVSG